MPRGRLAALPEPEYVDALPVLAEVSEVRPVDPGPQSLVQRVAALPAPVLAARAGSSSGSPRSSCSGCGIRAAARSRIGGRRSGTKVEIAESRSFLVDIHLLKR